MKKITISILNIFFVLLAVSIIYMHCARAAQEGMIYTSKVDSFSFTTTDPISSAPTITQPLTNQVIKPTSNTMPLSPDMFQSNSKQLFSFPNLVGTSGTFFSDNTDIVQTSTLGGVPSLLYNSMPEVTMSVPSSPFTKVIKPYNLFIPVGLKAASKVEYGTVPVLSPIVNFNDTQSVKVGSFPNYTNQRQLMHEDNGWNFSQTGTLGGVPSLLYNSMSGVTMSVPSSPFTKVIKPYNLFIPVGLKAASKVEYGTVPVLSPIVNFNDTQSVKVSSFPNYTNQDQLMHEDNGWNFSQTGTLGGVPSLLYNSMPVVTMSVPSSPFTKVIKPYNLFIPVGLK